MKSMIFIIAIIAISIVSCNNNNTIIDTHSHEDLTVADDGHDHEAVTNQYTVYTDKFELFAESDPFVLGENSHVLAHFSLLPRFIPLSDASVKITLNIEGAESHQTLLEPTKSGIYEFSIKPRKAGTGSMIFNIEFEGNNYQVVVPEINVYADAHSALHVPTTDQSTVNTIGFTKEQSWKIDFATELPKVEPMGQVIKTTAQINSTPKDEILLTAGISGLIFLTADGILEGKKVVVDELLFTISGKDLLDNNSEVRFIEAKTAFELAKSEYDRASELAKERIISNKELLIAKRNYDNAKVVYNNLKDNYNRSGQSIFSPVNGFIKQLLVINGQYVDVGEPIVSISRNETLFLHADVQQKYHSILDNINSATIKSLYDNKVYTLEGLNGKIVSYGRTTNIHNFLIPINLEIDYVEGFMPGSFVELYLKTTTNKEATTIPVSAILEIQGYYFVFVQITPELFEMREVKIGATDGLKTEILQGLSKDERVVTKGAVHIKLARGTGALDAHSGHVH